MNNLEDRFANTLRTNHIRVTKARKEVFDVLQSAHEAMPLSDIARRIKTADRASVYRSLALFEELHLVSVVLVGWKKHFELSAPYRNHHHHIYCEHCGKVVSLHSESLENIIKTLSRKKGFELHQHTLELSGICKNCKQKSAR